MPDLSTSQETTGGAIKDADIIRYSEESGGSFTSQKQTLGALKSYMTSGVIVVGNEWNTPELWGDGVNSVGTSESSRLLNTLIDPDTGVAYTDISAAAQFPDVTGIDVTTWEYDEACVDQWHRSMEKAFGSASGQCHDNRIYLYRQNHNMATVSQWTSGFRNATFEYDLHGSRHMNISGAPRTLWKRTPATQAIATNNGGNAYTSYKVIIRNGTFIGANLGTRDSGDCCIELSASYGSMLLGVDCLKADMGLRAFMGLGLIVLGGHYSENSRSGILVASGVGYGAGDIWTGSGLSTSASNKVVLAPSRVATLDGGFTGIEAYCADGLKVEDTPYEGSFGSSVEHHIYIESQGATTNKAIKISNLHMEQAASVSHICINQNVAQRLSCYIDMVLPYLADASPTMFEARTSGASSRLTMKISDCPNKDTGWLFRQVGGDTTVNWFVDLVQFVAPLTPYDPSNWDLTGSGVIPDSAGSYFNQLRIAP